MKNSLKRIACLVTLLAGVWLLSDRQKGSLNRETSRLKPQEVVHVQGDPGRVSAWDGTLPERRGVDRLGPFRHRRTSPFPSGLGRDPLVSAGSLRELQDDPTALQELIEEIVIGPDEDRRALAVSILGFLQPHPEIIQTATLALSDPSEGVRAEAVLALSSLTGDSLVDELVRIEIEDPSELVRQTATRALRGLVRRSIK